jgi:hypothetical protein
MLAAKLEGPVCLCHVDEKCPVHAVSVKSKLESGRDRNVEALRQDAVMFRERERLLRGEAALHETVALEAMKEQKKDVAAAAARQAARARIDADMISKQAEALEKVVKAS